MRYNEITQSELNQTTTDLLLQESIQTNQKLEQLQNLLISVKDMNNILPESIENVMFKQLKNQQDLQEKSHLRNEEELQKSKELHNSQLNEMKEEFNNKIENYQKETENQLNKLRKENQVAIIDKCKKLFEGAESRISEIVENTSDDFRSAANAAGKLIVKNLLFNFVTSLVLLAVAIGGYIYIQNYRDGTRIAEEKAVEALAEERAKFADEMEIERTKLENEIALKKRLIERNAVASYKDSESYREDACRFVASNICNIYCLQYMYIYIKSDDIKKYPELKSFYNDFIKRGYKEYKKNYSD